MKCTCGGKTNVTSTEQREKSVFRRRKCTVCKKNFATLEEVTITPGTGAHNQHGGIRRPKKEPKPDARGIYTKKDAAEIKRIKVEARRKAEDRRNKVPNYFIEDEEDY